MSFFERRGAHRHWPPHISLLTPAAIAGGHMRDAIWAGSKWHHVSGGMYQCHKSCLSRPWAVYECRNGYWYCCFHHKLCPTRCAMFK